MGIGDLNNFDKLGGVDSNIVGVNFCGADVCEDFARSDTNMWGNQLVFFPEFANWWSWDVSCVSEFWCDKMDDCKLDDVNVFGFSFDVVCDNENAGKPDMEECVCGVSGVVWNRDCMAGLTSDGAKIFELDSEGATHWLNNNTDNLVTGGVDDSIDFWGSIDVRSIDSCGFNILSKEDIAELASISG